MSVDDGVNCSVTFVCHVVLVVLSSPSLEADSYVTPPAAFIVIESACWSVLAGFQSSSTSRVRSACR